MNYLKTEYDVIICGAGLAGLALARQITREIPGISLIIIEGMGDKGRTGAIQVGESTIEISANYLSNVLGLKEYLETSHYRKWGLRFFFGNGSYPIQDRPELGTSHASPINSFQLDRAVLETDLKQINTDAGIEMLRETKVEDIVFSNDNGLHDIKLYQASTNRHYSLKCRWIIDAMGRRRFIQKTLGIAQPLNPKHSAAWFRLKGRIDVCDLVPRSDTQWHARVPDNNRFYSTNHLMDNGRWVWLIPLASGHTSIGIVTHEDFFPFQEYNTYEKALFWLEKHEPILWHNIQSLPPVDFQVLRHYSYSANKIYSIQRWACTGDAAVFADPFLSPGIDQIGFGNTIITEMITRERANLLDTQTVENWNGTFLSFHEGTTWITQPAYAFFGSGLVMGTKLIWDFARGFSINASQRFNNIYLDQQKSDALLPILSPLFVLTQRMEKFFRAWALRTSGRYAYSFVDYFAIPGMLELYHRHFQTNRSLDDLVVDHQLTFEYLEELAQIIFLLALADTMPEVLPTLPSPLWLNIRGIGLDPKRWKADKLFAPTTRPRPLKLNEFATIFGVTDIPKQLVTV